jgi:hypothetical protein
MERIISLVIDFAMWMATPPQFQCFPVFHGHTAVRTNEKKIFRRKWHPKIPVQSMEHRFFEGRIKSSLML